MFSSNNGYSLADIAAATRNTNNDNSMFGNGSWWIIILFLFAFGGWGNGLFGGFGNGFGGVNNPGFQGALTRGELCQDMNLADIQSGVRGIQQGLCDGFYAMNTGMLNGFANLTNNLTSEFRGLDNAVAQLGYQSQDGFNAMNLANIQNTNSIVSQLNNLATQSASCCCETQRQIERGFCDINYNLATQSCDTRRAISDSTRDIVDNQNANTRAILDFLTQDKISTLENENQALRLSASQQAQNNYLVNALRPAPVPAFSVPAPYCYGGANNYGYNYGCGC